VPLGDPLLIDTMIGCIVQLYKRGLVQVCNELVSEPNNIVVTIENFVVVPLMVALLLGAKGPHRKSLIGSLDGCTEALPYPLVLLLLIDDILIHFAIVQVTTNNLAVGIMFNMKQITDRVSDPGLLH
jgi:hypothetical protein